ncbi:hypothetical protein EJ05DRAFT_471637 [Pseudovirgaria hyperparasitica]|uniref:Uncharacterized protein n=1 Tax=Pseudovirgaria hyperparasitica TaxID=470096 RepID=A0A6A6WKH9_9PEZI|nr:uncharacterized protein EJ05DRAFT_471637 [Pseudovirgaria hyperparasitica]KAF2762666.1 hypothetical protein EJ05DRAFT_471637 [Pseudovirgaria hyperparasitica]
MNDGAMYSHSETTLSLRKPSIALQPRSNHCVREERRGQSGGSQPRWEIGHSFKTMEEALPSGKSGIGG